MHPQVLRARAQLHGWTAITRQQSTKSVIILGRDGWRIRVGFTGTAPTWASIRKPGQRGYDHLDRRQINSFVRGDRAQMSTFQLGQRVLVGKRAGRVTDIFPNGGGQIRLAVTYDDGHKGEPFTTFTRPLAATA